MSPSSRRAWIEIDEKGKNAIVDDVALLAEGVDRNIQKNEIGKISVSVALLAEGVDRNSGQFFQLGFGHVALLAEGVDRNTFSGTQNIRLLCRPPRGGRG